MKFVGKFRTIELDLPRFRKDLSKELQEVLAQSAFAWLNAATSVVPVWSGAARSTFKPLADRISFQLAISPKSTAPDRRSEGESEGTGDFDIDVPNGKFFFTYSTTLAHLIFNEFNANPANDPNAFAPGAITGTPYGFLGKAQQAWQRVADTVRLPVPQIKAGRSIRVG